MAVTHMTPRGSGYTTAVNKAPAFSAGVVGYTGFRGTAALPAYSFEEDPDTGVYSSAANNLDLSAAGAVVANVSASGVSVTGAVVGSTQFSAALGTKTAPGYSFTGDLNTGIYSSGADAVDVSIADTRVATFDASGLTLQTSGDQIIVPLNTKTAPGYSFTGDVNTGIFSSGADAVAVSCGDTLISTFSSTGLSVVGTVTASTDLIGDVGSGNNVIWFPATALPAIYFTTGTWTNTRGAAGTYFVRRSATVDETTTIEIPFSYVWGKSTASKGFQLLGLRYAYAIATNALTAHTYDLLDAVYAHAAAVTVGTAWGGTITGTLGTATTTNLDVIALTTGTDSYITDLTGLYLQVTIDFSGSATVYDCHGLFLDGNFTA